MSTTDQVTGNIRAEMSRRKIQQNDLAAALGISQSQLSKRLNGVIVIDVEELTSIAEFLGVSLATLLPAEADAKVGAA